MPPRMISRNRLKTGLRTVSIPPGYRDIDRRHLPDGFVPLGAVTDTVAQAPTARMDEAIKPSRDSSGNEDDDQVTETCRLEQASLS